MNAAFRIFVCLFFNGWCVYAQSGDRYLFTTKPPGTALADEEYEYESGFGSEPAPILSTEEVSRVAKNPLTTPPCLHPSSLIKSNENIENHQRLLQLHRKEVLTLDDLYSHKVQLSGMLAVEKYVTSRNFTGLELKQYLGGCKQKLAGEILYLIFSAEETLYCQHVNCTGPVVLNQECRARIHIRNDAPWNPYYVNCQYPDFFVLPWRGLSLDIQDS